MDSGKINLVKFSTEHSLQVKVFSPRHRLSNSRHIITSLPVLLRATDFTLSTNTNLRATATIEGKEFVAVILGACVSRALIDESLVALTQDQQGATGDPAGWDAVLPAERSQP